MGLWPGDEYFEQPLRLRRRVRPRHAGAVGRPASSDFKGEYLQMDDCRLEPQPQATMKMICAGQSDAGMEFTAKYADYNFVLRQGHQHADRLRRHGRARCRRRRRQDRPRRRHLRPVHDHRRRDRRRGRWPSGSSTRTAPTTRRWRWLTEQSARRHQVGPPTPTSRHIVAPKSAREPQHGHCCAAPMPSVARMLDEIGDRARAWPACC